MGLSGILRVAALVLFIIGSLLAFQVFGNATVGQLFGILMAGLAAWVASTVDGVRGP
jgi:hypothetical protein